MQANKGKARPVRTVVAILLCLGVGLATATGPAVARVQPDTVSPVGSLAVAGAGLPSTLETTALSSDLSSHRIVATIPLTPGVGLEPRAIAADPRSPLVY
ncbi:MAG: hypothetical protein ACP5OO_13520, partial [Chloroflexia bacterium]